ncbi:hypothetical protein [Bacillus smithii]|uniref:hypothetical protein n=1 Tax=Bacillus smithii TaxID=1479 RepID=UPI0030C96186
MIDKVCLADFFVLFTIQTDVRFLAERISIKNGGQEREEKYERIYGDRTNR